MASNCDDPVTAWRGLTAFAMGPAPDKGMSPTSRPNDAVLSHSPVTVLVLHIAGQNPKDSELDTPCPDQHHRRADYH